MKYLGGFLVLFLLTFRLHADNNCISGAVDGYTLANASGTTVQPTQDNLNQTMSKIYAHLQEEYNTPDAIMRREGNGSIKHSYCLFHEAGRPISGTVLFFHGFSNRPQEMAKIASYLFNNGFDVYNPFLSKHYEMPGFTYWPKLLYNFVPNLNASDPNNDIAKIMHAYNSPTNSSDFSDVFKLDNGGNGQNFDAWMNDARTRLSELDAMPGPIFLFGLSLGSAIALRLGAEDGGNRIKGIVANAPYLAAHDPNVQQEAMGIGPLDNTSNYQTLPNPAFSVTVSAASVAAQYLIGKSLFNEDDSGKTLVDAQGQPIDNALAKGLANIPTFLVGTESDNSANTGRSYQLHQNLIRIAGSVEHDWFTYSADKGIGHAMTDPDDYPEPYVGPAQGGGRNYRYKSLYQESYDFFVKHNVNDDNLNDITMPNHPGQNPALPQVKLAYPNAPTPY